MAEFWAWLASIVSKLFGGSMNIGKGNQNVSVNGDGSAVAMNGSTVSPHFGNNINNPPPPGPAPGRIEINGVPDADYHNWYAVRDSREDVKGATHLHCVLGMWNLSDKACSASRSRGFLVGLQTTVERVLTLPHGVPIIVAILCRETPSGLTKYAPEPFGARMIQPGIPAQGSPHSFPGRIRRWPIA